MSNDDMRAQADALEALYGKPKEERQAPAENGIRLAAIPRGKDGDQEVRVNWADYEGRHYLNIRLWNKSGDGWFPDGKRGLSIRVRELPEFSRAIAQAMDLAMQDAQK